MGSGRIILSLTGVGRLVKIPSGNCPEAIWASVSAILPCAASDRQKATDNMLRKNLFITICGCRWCKS